MKLQLADRKAVHYQTAPVLSAWTIFGSFSFFSLKRSLANMIENDGLFVAQGPKVSLKFE